MSSCSVAFKFHAQRSAVFGLAALLACAPWGCGSIGQVRAYPLYPNPEQPRESQTLARLEGPIATVDGQDVSSKGGGMAFEILPGCHVVTLKRKMGEGSGNGAWAADLRPIAYAFRMRQGHRYSIETSVQFGADSQVGAVDESQVRANVDIFGATGGATHGQLTIIARERDWNGTLVRVVSPSRGGKDIEACKRWVAEEGAAGEIETRGPPAVGASPTPSSAQESGAGESSRVAPAPAVGPSTSIDGGA